MRRLRTAKAVASRIDLTYFKRRHSLRRARLIVTALCLVGALAWWGVYATRGDKMLYNPGPVAHAHAQWEQRCDVCHDANGKGGFFKTVSDTACLRCHDGSIHSEKQKQFIKLVAATGTPAANASAVNGTDGATAGAEKSAPAAHSRSANCTACHIEHRGPEAIAANSDGRCVQCHADLGKHTNGEALLEPHVTAFAVGSHPAFGLHLAATRPSTPATTAQQIADVSKTLVDPTQLQFNHAKHMGMDGINSRCAICHTTEVPNPLARPLGDDSTGAPPWTKAADSLKEPWSLVAQGTYMRPVSFDQHCAGCHGLKTDGKGAVDVPHERMDLVRGMIVSLPPDKLTWLAPKPAATSPGGGGSGPPRPGPRRAPTPGSGMAPDGTPIRAVLLAPRRPPTPGSSSTPDASTATPAVERPKTANDIAIENIRKLVKRLPSGNDQASQRKQQVVAALDELEKKYGSAAAPAPTTQPGASVEPTWAPDPTVVRFYAAYVADTQCAQCHTMVEDPAALKPIESGPALLVTAPTGISSTPRHWYRQSVFDHRSHRNVTCTDCHSRAETSTLTTDVLSPNMTWTTSSGAMHSCTDCHHAPDASGRGATSNCQSCHVYHDRSKEGPPLDVTTIDRIVGLSREPGHGGTTSGGAKPAVPATQPVASAAG